MGTAGQSGSRAIGQSGTGVSGARLRGFAAGVLLLVVTAPYAQAQHGPSIFITKQEAAAIRTSAAQYPLLNRSLAEAKQLLGDALARPIDVPQPGEAGGYAHEKHKQNYREMQLAGVLFQ